MKYTKRQIQEAIRHWEKVLVQMNESKSKLLDICSSKFGEDVIFSKEKKFELTHNNIENLYKVFDDYFFDSKLSIIKDLKLFSGNKNDLENIIGQYTKAQIDFDNFIALYQPLQCWQRNLQTNRIQLAIPKDAIFINIQSHNFSSFSYIAQALFHEMTHAYDMHEGGLYTYLVWAISAGAPKEVIDYNSHLTKIFKQKKQEFMNATNIEVQISGNNEDFDTLCRKTAENIEMLKETDEMKQTLNTPFNREIVNKYKNQNGIWISDDGTQFSFSFGIPMPN